MSTELCDYSLLAPSSCEHCHPEGPSTPTTEERAAAIVERIERGEARTTITETTPTPMDFAGWAESVTTRPNQNGTTTGRGNQ
jgi:hypothetical protein